MDGGSAAELHDWEVLPDSIDSRSVQNPSSLEGIEGDSEGVIRVDYFSLDSQPKYAPAQGEDDVSVESDNPSWIDPVSDTRYPANKEMGEFWSSDGSDDGKYAELEAKNSEPNILETAKRQARFDVTEVGSSMQLWSASGEIGAKTVKYGEIELGDIHDDLIAHEQSEASSEDEIVEARDQGENDSVGTEAMNEEKKKGPIWWKLPLDLLKYCLFKASPVWTVSVAAAMLGVLILGRRLYKLKHRSRTLQLKVTLDDKKVSQFTSRAARLNEAFSVVKLVPMIRPTLPAVGVAPYP